MGAGMFLNSMDPAHTSKVKLISRLSYYAEQIILCYAYNMSYGLPNTLSNI